MRLLRKLVEVAQTARTAASTVAAAGARILPASWRGVVTEPIDYPGVTKKITESIYQLPGGARTVPPSSDLVRAVVESITTELAATSSLEDALAGAVSTLIKSGYDLPEIETILGHEDVVRERVKAAIAPRPRRENVHAALGAILDDCGAKLMEATRDAVDEGGNVEAHFAYFLKNYKPSDNYGVGRLAEDLKAKYPDLKIETWLMEPAQVDRLIAAVITKGKKGSRLQQAIRPTVARKLLENDDITANFMKRSAWRTVESTNDGEILSVSLDVDAIARFHSYWIDGVYGKQGSKAFGYFTEGLVECIKSKLHSGSEVIKINDKVVELPNLSTQIHHLAHEALGFQGTIGGYPTIGKNPKNPLPESIRLLYTGLHAGNDAEKKKFFASLFGNPQYSTNQEGKLENAVKGMTAQAIAELRKLEVPWLDDVLVAAGEDCSFENFVKIAHDEENLKTRFGARIVVELVRKFNFCRINRDWTDRELRAVDLFGRLKENLALWVEKDDNSEAIKEDWKYKERLVKIIEPSGSRIIALIGQTDEELEAKLDTLKEKGLIIKETVDLAEQKLSLLKGSFHGVSCNFFLPEREHLDYLEGFDLKFNSTVPPIDVKDFFSMALKLHIDGADKAEVFKDNLRMCVVLDNYTQVEELVRKMTQTFNTGAVVKIKNTFRAINTPTCGVKPNGNSSEDLEYIQMVLYAEGIGEFEIQVVTKAGWAANKSRLAQTGHGTYEVQRQEKLRAQLIPSELFPEHYKPLERDPLDLDRRERIVPARPKPLVLAANDDPKMLLSEAVRQLGLATAA